MRRIALLGISGVGKSTLLRRLSTYVTFSHLQASDLIKAEQAFKEARQQNSEELRTGPVLDNQALLVAGFLRAASQTQLPIVFDGHSVIDGLESLIEIPTFVFESLKLDAICLLHAPPTDIMMRRAKDVSRPRPERSLEELDEHQKVAISVARRIASELDIPFYLVTQEDMSKIGLLVSGNGGGA